MAEDPALLITKWTLQRWNLCPTSFLYIKDKTAQLKIGSYLTDFFVGFFVLVLCSVIALTSEVVCKRAESVTAICKV